RGRAYCPVSLGWQAPSWLRYSPAGHRRFFFAALWTVGAFVITGCGDLAVQVLKMSGRSAPVEHRMPPHWYPILPSLKAILNQGKSPSKTSVRAISVKGSLSDRLPILRYCWPGPSRTTPPHEAATAGKSSLADTVGAAAVD